MEQEKKEESSYLVTCREPLDVINIQKNGEKIIEIIVISIKKNKVKLAIKADKTIRYYLSSAREDVH